MEKIKILKRYLINIIKKIFFNSSKYWEKRYLAGDNSGAGSYNKIAEFKATVLNDFIKNNNIQSILDFGCGDGNQVNMLKISKYVGLDVSEQAVKICKEKFKGSASKEFYAINKDIKKIINTLKPDMVISLDVIFHLVEDHVYTEYLTNLFSVNAKFVIIFSTNQNKKYSFPHQKDRAFTNDISRIISNYRLIQKIDNPYKGEDSLADFYIYQRT